ncbi:MAG: Fic family protein [Gammaproteobacteria bacterium]|nr:Fic family protein [Gammaproteobacteria bacterium]
MMDSEALAAAISEWRERRATMREEDDERLWRKLRLEWNYNSNHIEGNTLSYYETELLLIHGRTAGGHPMRHYEEMKAHDASVDHTRNLASAERVLGEGDIRDLNKILLKEPFWHIAQTPDGQQTRKRIVPGEYKTQPNHVRTATGELHRFAEPEETPALMQAWISDFRLDLGDSALSESRLPLFLAESHWSFLRIHPFDDGNGRTARLLTNYVLLRSGLPPMVIKSADRDRYIGALQNADVGRMEPLAGFMLENVLWSLGLAIRAAKGESIRDGSGREGVLA